MFYNNFNKDQGIFGKEWYKVSIRFLINRIVYTLLMFLIVITLNFCLFRLMPGDPLSMVSREIGNSPEARAALEKVYGLDKPKIVQFVDYVKNMLTFDFGTSFFYKKPVWDVLKPKIWSSLVLGIASTPLGIGLGILGGIWAAKKHGKRTDMVITSTTMIIYAVPTFWLGMIFLMVFSVKLGWFPVNGMTTPGASFATKLAYITDLLLHTTIPAITYALATFGSYLLIMRSSMIDVFTEDFVLTARAKGLTDRQVTYRHVVPNALLPVSTIIATSFALLFTGAFSIEILFSWPGMGRLMVDAITQQDYPILQASNYLIACSVILVNFAMDIIYMYIDPRVRAE